MATTEYTVTGMSCGHCEKAISEEVSAIPGVSEVRVSAEDGTLAVDSDTPLDDAAILAAVEEAGYEAERA